MHNAEIYAKLLQNGITNVWLTEMEFLDADAMASRKQLWNDTLRMDGLTVFAVNGYGDLFAWREDDSVLFIEIGPGTCQKYAANLPDAVFRRIMEFAGGSYTPFCTDDDKSGMDPDDAEDYLSETEAASLLREYRDAFGACFTDAQNACLDKLIAQGFLPDEEAFLSGDALFQMFDADAAPESLLR
ncbi:MAG: hypothetical protein K5695_08365 [Oscillospiraceae bacterium]|nr:hypothetical protein [Oscillospiraceae bacterium]